MEFTNRHAQSKWIFRGVADKEFKLLPKIGRDSNKYDRNTEEVIFANFSRRVRYFIDTTGFDEWDLLALAQHHGLPTRLLDWTNNPLVAAYFAVSSMPLEKTARVHAVRVRKKINRKDYIHPFDVVEDGVIVPSAITARIVSQRGLFTIHGQPGTAWEPPEVGSPDHYFDIEPDDRRLFQRRLFYFGIDPSHIKGDIDGLCDALAWQYDRGIAVGTFNF
jgi:hypothetical protein